MTIENDVLGLKNRRQTVNSKAKGNANERVAAKFLQTWTGAKFARTPSSGGLHWKNNASVAGDVVCVDQDFKWIFCVETKALKSIGIIKNTLSRKSVIFKIMEQAHRDAARCEKIPMVMVRKNGMPAGEYWIFLPHWLSHALGPLLAKLPASDKLRLEGRTEKRNDVIVDVIGIHSTEFALLKYYDVREVLRSWGLWK